MHLTRDGDPALQRMHMRVRQIKIEIDAPPRHASRNTRPARNLKTYAHRTRLGWIYLPLSASFLTALCSCPLVCANGQRSKPACKPTAVVEGGDPNLCHTPRRYGAFERCAIYVHFYRCPVTSGSYASDTLERRRARSVPINLAAEPESLRAFVVCPVLNYR